jgi:hypothetical protein
VPLQQRLETLESFMVKEQVINVAGKAVKQSVGKGIDWKPKVSPTSSCLESYSL